MLPNAFRSIDRTVEYALFLIFLAFTLVGGLQVFNRFVLGLPLSWSEEFQKFGHIWMVMLAIPVAYRRGAHLGMDMLLRLLPKDSKGVALDHLGMQERHLKLFASLIAKPYGMILVTGPTGAGKTTTLACMIEHINANSKKHIITLEDPIEYVFEDNQSVIEQREVGLDTTSFHNALKHVLRQDPDVIMVGEMRDLETAQISIQASLTGHLVLSTLHTNDSPGAVTRLTDMGVEPFLVASSVVGVVAQRLVRLICKFCKEERQPKPELIKRLNAPAEKYFAGKGCKNCDGTGFRGDPVHGTGLSIVRALVRDELRGTLRLESEGGLRAEVVFPA